MGSFISSLVTPPADSSSDGDSAVISAHSMAEWDRHWSAHTQTPNKLMVIDFSASWCGPCRFMEPSFKAMAAKYADAVFVKIDVDEVSAVSQRWNVQAMPTFVLVKGGKEVGRVVGAKKDELEGKIQQHIRI